MRYPVRVPERGPRWQTHAQRRNLRISVSVDQVHVSGALSGARTGKGPQMANPRPTPKPENFLTVTDFGGGRWYNRFSCSGEESVSELELVAGKQVERADFSSADNRSVRPPSLSEVERSHRRNLRRLAFSGFHGLPPKISDGQRISVSVDQVHVSGALSGACTGKGPQMANPRPTPKPENFGLPWPPGTSGNPAGYSRGRLVRGLKMIVGSLGIPWGLTPPAYELAPHTGLDKAPPRMRDEGRLDARATSHWSRIVTQHRSCLPGAVTST